MDMSKSINIEPLLEACYRNDQAMDTSESLTIKDASVGSNAVVKFYESDDTIDWPLDFQGNPIPSINVTMVHGGSGGGGAAILKTKDGKFLAAASGAGGHAGPMFKSMRIDYPILTFRDKPVRLHVHVGRGGRAGSNIVYTLDDNGTLECTGVEAMASGRFGSCSQVTLSNVPRPVMIFGPNQSLTDSIYGLNNQAQISNINTVDGRGYWLRAGHTHYTEENTQFYNYGSVSTPKSCKTSNNIIVNYAYYAKQIKPIAPSNTPPVEEKLPVLKMSWGKDTSMHSMTEAFHSLSDHNPESYMIDSVEGGHGTVAWMDQNAMSKPRPGQQHPLSNTEAYMYTSFTQYTGYAVPTDQDDVLKMQCEYIHDVPADIIDEAPLPYANALEKVQEECKKMCWTWGGAAGMGHAVDYPLWPKMVGQGGHGGYVPKPGVMVDPQPGNDGIVMISYKF